MAVGLIAVATEEDIDALLALARDDSIATFLAVDTTDDLAAAGPGSEVLVARDGDAILGAVRGAWTNRRSRIVTVRALMVAPSARGRRLGVQLVQAACDRAFEAGAHRVQAEVYGDNAPALGCFERAGFRREGVRRQAYDRRGAWQDGIHLGLLADDEGNP